MAEMQGNKIDGVIAITGAGAGLGRALAIECLERGYSVLALVLESSEASSLREEVRDAGERLETRQLDITKPGDFSFPANLAALVNNAGIRLKNLPIEHVPLDDWRLTMEVNFFGAVELIRRAIPVLRARGSGLICNINSASLYAPIPFLGAYRAAKGAMAAFTETLRTEVTPFNIKILEIMPSAVRTGINVESVTRRIAHAADYADYEPMARAQRAMFENRELLVQDAADAASIMLNIMQDNKNRMRHGINPGWEVAMDRWRKTGGEAEIADFIIPLLP